MSESDRHEPLTGLPGVKSYLGVSDHAVYRLVAAGLPHYKVAAKLRFRLSEIDAWLERQKQQ